jgi:magnesium transporter
MLKAYKFQKGGVKIASSKDLATATIAWTDSVNPSPKELKEISEKAKIPLTDLKMVLDKEERPKVSDLENYSLIIIRTPIEEHGKIFTTPIAIFVSKNKNNIITLALKPTGPIKKVEELIISKKVELHIKGIGFFIYTLIDQILNDYFTILDEIEEKIDDIEDRVVAKPDKLTVHHIFTIKRTLIFFHRALTANREVITAIEKEYVTHIDKKNIRRFRNLYNDVTQLIESEGTYRDILTGTLDIYLSSVSNNLNQVMKTLTIVASFVLIPTLISGIYGMNFNNASPYNMPELYWQYGYFFALGLMLISVIVTFAYFKKKEWL